MLRRFSLPFVCALLVILSPARTTAQTSVAFAELQIAFWPEYDQPAMLVIYRGTLSPDTPLPVPVRIDIPARYGPPSAVAFGDPQGQLFDLVHTVSVADDTMTIAFDAPSAYFQFEYYDTSLDLTSATRRYSFKATAPLSIETLILQVQEPLGASDLLTAPAMGAPTVGNDGLTYIEAYLTGLEAGDPITLDLSYSKPTADLSVNALSPVVTPQLPAPSTQSPLNNTVLSLITAVAGALVLGGAVVWYLRMRNPPAAVQPEPGPRRRARARAQAPRAKEGGLYVAEAEAARPDSASTAYCHECGVQSRSDDRFCRNCGTALRR
jgi:hypothetical protein